MVAWIVQEQIRTIPSELRSTSAINKNYFLFCLPYQDVVFYTIYDASYSQGKFGFFILS